MPRAQRYQLRFVPGVSVTAATYGSSTFGGDITYGQRASDPLTSYRYRIVPLPAGYPTAPGWLYRHGDMAMPMQAQILSDAGALDLVAVASGNYVLTPIDARGGQPPSMLSVAVVAPSSNGIISHTWSTSDPILAAGTYRVVVMLSFTSGRRFTLPTDDNLRLTVTGLEVS